MQLNGVRLYKILAYAPCNVPLEGHNGKLTCHQCHMSREMRKRAKRFARSASASPIPMKPVKLLAAFRKPAYSCHNGISHSYLGIRYHVELPLLFLGINWDAPESQTLLKEFPCYSAMSRLKTLFRTCFLYHIPKEFSNVSEFNLKELFRAKHKRILPEFFEKFLFWQCRL